jgi:hypothetical protein
MYECKNCFGEGQCGYWTCQYCLGSGYVNWIRNIIPKKQIKGHDFIVENKQNYDIFIKDLGYMLLSKEKYDLTDIFGMVEILGSKDLSYILGNGEINRCYQNY